MAEPQQLELAAAAALPVADALSESGSSAVGLSSVEAGRRLAVYGPNVLLSHGVSALSVLVRQLRSYLLLLLLVAAVVSAVVGDRIETLIIGGIMLMSVGLSFPNEYRSEKAVEALHSQIHHLAFVDRDGRPAEVSVTEIVPGDVVHLRVGDVVPAVASLAPPTCRPAAGRMRIYVLFFISLATRRIEYIACTSSPDGCWTTQQARNLVMQLGDEQPFRFLVHDRDTKFRHLRRGLPDR